MYKLGGHNLTNSKIIFYNYVARKTNILLTLHLKYVFDLHLFPTFKEMKTLPWTPESTVGPGTTPPGPDGEVSPAATLTPR